MSKQDYSGVQPWSKGHLYPYVVYAQQTPDGLRWGLIGGELVEYRLIGTYDEAVQEAEKRLECRQRGVAYPWA